MKHAGVSRFGPLDFIARHHTQVVGLWRGVSFWVFFFNGFLAAYLKSVDWWFFPFWVLASMRAPHALLRCLVLHTLDFF